MAIDWLLQDAPEFLSRGERISSVLSGDGSFDTIPGHPDVQATIDDWKKEDKYNPEIDFDPNAYSRMDKFDAVEIGQGLIDSALDSGRSPTAEPSSTSEGGK